MQILTLKNCLKRITAGDIVEIKYHDYKSEFLKCVGRLKFKLSYGESREMPFAHYWGDYPYQYNPRAHIKNIYKFPKNNVVIFDPFYLNLSNICRIIKPSYPSYGIHLKEIKGSSY